MIPYLTLAEVAAYLRVHPTTVYRLIRRQGLPCFRFGTRDYRFDPDAVDAWRRAQQLADTGYDLWLES